MAIRYEAYTWQGEKVQGVLQVDSEEAAFDQLRQQQLIPYRANRIRRWRSLVEIAPSLFRPKSKDVIDFYRQLASLVDSGIPLQQSLGVLRDETRNLGMRHAIARVTEDVESGTRFSDACNRHPTVFGATSVYLLRVGESTGTLTTTLRQLADDSERASDVVTRVRRALAYPVISIIVGIIAVALLVRFSIPALVAMLDEFGGELPATTKALIVMADFLELYGTYAMVGFVALSAVGLVYIRSPKGKRVFHRALLRMPIIGKIVTSGTVFALTSNLSQLLKSGVPPIEALQLSRETVPNVAMKDQLLKDQLLKDQLLEVSREVEEGGRLGEAFRNQPVFPRLLAQGITTAELSGSLVVTLAGLADYYETQTREAVGVATEMIQPIATLVVGGIVGFLAVAVIGGVYSAIGSFN